MGIWPSAGTVEVARPPLAMSITSPFHTPDVMVPREVIFPCTAEGRVWEKRSLLEALVMGTASADAATSKKDEVVVAKRSEFAVRVPKLVPPRSTPKTPVQPGVKVTVSGEVVITMTTLVSVPVAKVIAGPSTPFIVVVAPGESVAAIVIVPVALVIVTFVPAVKVFANQTLDEPIKSCPLEGVVAMPVPPLPIASALVKVSEAKAGVEVTAISIDPAALVITALLPCVKVAIV